MTGFLQVGFLILTVVLSGVANSEEDPNLCYGFQRVQDANFSDLNGVCLGIVARGSDIGWTLPRKIQFFSKNEIYVTDLGRWSAGAGKVFKLDISRPNEGIGKKLIYSDGDRTHGIAKDSKGRLLIGDANAILRKEGRIFRIVINDLPNGGEGGHPLTEFIVLPNDDIILNVGSSSDTCQDELEQFGNCPSRDSEAQVRHYKYSVATDSYDKGTVLAKGLRNSMALTFNSKTKEVYQLENGIDDVKILKEEFNVFNLDTSVIEDFGWPYCVGKGQVSHVMYDGVQLVSRNYQNFCLGSRTKDPLFDVPAFSAALHMQYYHGEMFPELNGSLLAGWHGHRREVNQALVAYPTNFDGQPVSDRFLKLLGGKTTGGLKIRPVGLAVDQKGAIWFVDDKTKLMFVLASTSVASSGQSAETKWSLDRVKTKFGLASLAEFDELYTQFQNSEQSCADCHSGVFQESEESIDALVTFLNEGWLVEGGAFEQQGFVYRMFGPLGRTMPSGGEPYSITQPEIAKGLKLWVEQNLK